MERKILTNFAIVAVAAGMVLSASAQTSSQSDNTAAQVAQQNQDQTHMSAALGHLKNADQQLQQASSDKGGHRVRAMQVTEQAMSQVEQGIQYAKTEGARSSAAVGQPPASSIEADQNALRIAQENRQVEPRMAGALEELAQADKELEQAGTNKGGHRMQAMQLIQQAMSEVQQGVQYYSQHVSGGTASQAAPASSSGSAGVVRITNGPVIERADQNSATIAWSTDHEGSTVVDYGTDPNNLNQKAQAPWGAGGLTHRVELKNLKPGTRYYFEVETGQARGTNGGEVESNRFSFQTPNAGQPPIQNQQPQAARF